MVDIEKCVREFVKYSKKFDLTVPPIMRKFHHTFRVMEYCKDIATDEKLSKEDISLAMLCGLLHDIGRFEQWTKYGTYIDSKSIDHGELGGQILLRSNFIKHFVKEKESQDLVILTVRNHNKRSIADNLDDKTCLICKIVRDADKIDIMKEQCNTLTKRFTLKEDIKNSMLKNGMINNVIVLDEADLVFRQLAFIFDCNYKYTFELIKKEHIIENKINLLMNYSDQDEDLGLIQNHLLEYINNKIG